jgi:hypothetical protein
MSQHLSQSDIQNLRERTLSPELLLAVDTHLAGCTECLATVAESVSGDVTGSLPDLFLSETDMDEHLTYEQLTAYVDGEIGNVDKEIVDVHKAVCQDCSDQLAELLHLRTTLQIDTEPVAATAEIPRGSSLSGLWSAIKASSVIRFGAPVFGAVLLGVIVWAVWVGSRRTPVEMVEVIDTMDTTQAANGKTEDLTPVDGLNSNSGISKPTVSLADAGSRIEIDENGNLTGLNAPQFEGRVKAALTMQNIVISSATRELRANSGVLMGDRQPGAPFALTTPVGRVVESDRPEFRWRALSGAESYVVTIYDANFNKVASSPELRQPGWTPTAKLRRGGIYQWQVTAVKDGEDIKSPVRPAPDARFKVIDAAAANDIDAAKRTNGNSHLLLGIVYANAGLLDDAEREFQALLNQNPKSEVARKLLTKVRSAR